SASFPMAREHRRDRHTQELFRHAVRRCHSRSVSRKSPAPITRADPLTSSQDRLDLARGVHPLHEGLDERVEVAELAIRGRARGANLEPVLDARTLVAGLDAD